MIDFFNKEFHVVVPTLNDDGEEIDNENYNKIPTSDRGKGGFGSSGTK